MPRHPSPLCEREEREELMGTIVSSLLVIAVGAILRFAVTASVVGVTLSVVGAIGLVLGIYFKLPLSSNLRALAVVRADARGTSRRHRPLHCRFPTVENWRNVCPL